MSSSQKSLSKSEKWLAGVCTLAFLTVTSVAVFYHFRDADPRWNLAPAPTAPSPNGYHYYIAAAKATVRFIPEVDPASDVHATAPNTPYAIRNYSLPRRLKWLKANSRTFALFNQGLTTPVQTPDYAPDQVDDFVRLRQLARDNSARSRTIKMQHLPMRATMNALDGMQMGQDIGRSSGLLPRLVGIAIMAITRDPLEDWNKTINALSASEARTAARRLETLLAHEPTSAQTLATDRRRNLLELRQLFATPNWRNSFRSQMGLGLPTKDDSFRQTWARQTISKQRIYDNVNQAIDAEIVNAHLPYSKMRKASSPKFDVFTDAFVITKSRTTKNDIRNATSNNMLLLRLALRAYIAENKQAPPTLSALVPGILKSIPTDAYNDGRPLFYQAKGRTYKLWSVGPDGVNNGGVPFSRRAGEPTIRPVTNLLTNTGDFVAGQCR